MKHYMNGLLVNPKEQFQIGIKARFSDRITDKEPNVTSIVLYRKDYERVKQHFNSIGSFEGIPYQMITNSGVTLDYFIDLTAEPLYSETQVEVSIVKRKSIDKFMDDANGSSFEMMASKGVIFNTIDHPYVIIKDSQAETAIVLSLALFNMTQQLIQSAQDLIETSNALIQAVTPNLGVPPSYDLGDITTLSFRLSFQIFKTAIIYVACLKLAQQIRELIFPKVRYLKACKVKELISKGCQYLGYGFSSTLLDGISGLAILPRPLLRKKPKKWYEYLQNDLDFAFNNGYPSMEDSTPTLGSLIDFILKTYNCRIREINGTIHIERRDYWQSVTLNSLMPALTNQEITENQFTYNTNESWKRYVIKYLIDPTDKFTSDEFEGANCEYSAEPVNVINSDLVTIKNLVEITIPFSLAYRKNKLNWLETLAYELLSNIDSVINSLGGNSSSASLIEERLGVTKLSEQYFTNTKLLYLVGTKQPENFLDILKADAIYQDYHTINQIENNGFQLYKGATAKFSENDFVNLLNNNYFNVDGVVCECEEFEYIEGDGVLVFNYRKPSDYAVGKIKTIKING